MTVDAPRLVRLYGLVVGGGLLLEGGGLLLLDVVRSSTSDTRHNALHLVWGVTMVGLLAMNRHPLRAVMVGLVFGALYTALGIAGVVFDRPFGLLLGPGENAFHLIVGPLALLLGGWAAVQLWSNSVSNAASVASAAPGSGSGSEAAPR